MKRELILMLCGVVFSCEVLAVDVSIKDRREEDVNADIVTRCFYEMGEFGKAGLEACVDSEKKERKALSDYPEDTARLVRRCIAERYLGGWQRIRACVDSDISAGVALDSVPPELADVVAACTRQHDVRGPAAIKACVDERQPKRDDGGD